ncbi:hypothetical protein [Thermospira aquatica]|nr:hypothetical protein [Thermospira aquatica]
MIYAHSPQAKGSRREMEWDPSGQVNSRNETKNIKDIDSANRF